MKMLRRWYSTRRSGLDTNYHEVRSIINKFIRPNASAPKSAPTNNALMTLYNNWKLAESEPLPLTTPIPISPYQFLSTHNSDVSYIRIPRLAVTKLLTDSWCELREYYTLYAGSPPYEVTKAMELGLGHHTGLELQLHVQIDTTILFHTWKRLIDARLEALKEDIAYPDYVALAYGNLGEGEYASALANHAIDRMFSLLTTSQAREVLVHGFLNLGNRSFINTTSELLSVESQGKPEPSKVLVSGIVDHFQLMNRNDSSDLTMFQEINDYIEYEYEEQVEGSRLIDLTKLFKDIPEIISEHTNNYSIRTSDVKTRSYNKAPQQQSILNAAKHQTFYYRRMLELLARQRANDHFGYYSFIENAKTRGLDVDKPLSLTALLIILRKHYSLLYLDFVKLARGEPIGFELFDNHYIHSEYNVSSLVNSYEVDRLSKEDNFDYHKLLTPTLLASWKKPPTIRYFAARSYQFYSLFADFIGDQTRVEYHNGKSGMQFHANNYKYDSDVMNSQIAMASTFWNGDRPPNHTKDISRCKNCTFSAKCTVPNEGLDGTASVGVRLHQFLHTNEM